MSPYWTLAFWQAVAERAISTFFQALVAVLAVTGDLTALAELTADEWRKALVGALIGAGLSVAKSIAAAQTGTGSPSLSNSEELPVAEGATGDVDQGDVDEFYGLPELPETKAINGPDESEIDQLPEPGVEIA